MGTKPLNCHNAERRVSLKIYTFRARDSSLGLLYIRPVGIEVAVDPNVEAGESLAVSLLHSICKASFIHLELRIY